MSLRWTRADDAVLRANWPKGGMAAVRGLLPERSEIAIAARVRELQLHVAHNAVIRKPRRAKDGDCRPSEIAFWLATWLFSGRPCVPDPRRIMVRWKVSRATAYRWWRWASDKLEQMRARTGAPQEDDVDARRVH